MGQMQPGLDCLTRGHLLAEMVSPAGETYGNWCMWCGTAVYDAAKHDEGRIDPADVDPARVLAALDVLGWPDDRDGSAHAEPDGYEVTPARHYWELVSDVIRATDAARLVEGTDR